MALDNIDYDKLSEISSTLKDIRSAMENLLVINKQIRDELRKLDKNEF